MDAVTLRPKDVYLGPGNVGFVISIGLKNHFIGIVMSVTLLVLVNGISR